MKLMKKVLTLCLAALLLTGTALAIEGGDNQVLPEEGAALPTTLSVARGLESEVVTYKNLPNGDTLEMKIILPPEGSVEGGKAPCVVMTRGSGLRAVNLDALDQYMAQLEMIAAQGFVVAGIEFRGYTTEPMELGMFPAATQDCHAAVRFLKASADKYGIDPDRIGVIGQSSGGWECTMLAVTNGAWGVAVPEDVEGAPLGELYYSEADADAAAAKGVNVLKLDTAEGDALETAKDFSSEVFCAIDLYGIGAMDKIGAEDQHTLEKNNAQEEVKFMTADVVTEIWDTPYVHTAANPYWYIDAQDAEKLAFLFMHGTADNRVYPLSTERFFELSKENGIEAYRFLIPGAGHGGPRFMEDDTSTIYLDFFAEQLQGYTGNRAVFPPVAGGTLEVTLNGEAVDVNSYKLQNLTASDKVSVKAVVEDGYAFKGLQVVSVDDDYAVSSYLCDEVSYSFSGDKCVTVTGVWEAK